MGFFFSKMPGLEIEKALGALGKPMFYSDIKTDSGMALTVSVVVQARPFDRSAIPDHTQVNKQALFDKSAVGRSGLSAILFNAPDEHTALQLVQISGVAIQENLTTDHGE